MSYSDDVRAYCKKNYVDVARTKGEKRVSIRAGDIHAALNYQNRMPLVCSALGSNKFEEMCNVKRASITGPANGANAVFTFELI